MDTRIFFIILVRLLSEVLFQNIFALIINCWDRFLMRSLGRFIHTNQDKCDDQYRQCRRSGITAQRQSTFVDGLVKEIAQNRSQRTGQDESRPKQRRV